MDTNVANRNASNLNKGDCVDVKVDVPHVRQKHNWDCGLACLQMILRYFAVDQKDFADVCKRLNFGESVWTIDLAHILRHYSIRHLFCTITVGVDKGYSTKSFYKDRFTADELRVTQSFENAAAEGINFEKRSVTADEIKAHLSHRHLLIVLADWSYLDCKWCTGQKILSAINCSCFGKCLSVYQGHFIVVCGYNENEDVIYYKNPSYHTELCCCSMKTFEAARKSHGTDEDIIFIYDQEHQQQRHLTESSAKV